MTLIFIIVGFVAMAFTPTYPVDWRCDYVKVFDENGVQRFECKQRIDKLLKEQNGKIAEAKN